MYVDYSLSSVLLIKAYDVLYFESPFIIIIFYYHYITSTPIERKVIIEYNKYNRKKSA